MSIWQRLNRALRGNHSASLRELKVTGCRILIAEDDEDSREMLATHLSLQGHILAIAHDGLGALDLSRDFLPHLVCTDIAMPRLNGIELRERILHNPQTSSCIFFA